MAGSSKTDGEQTRALLREMRALRSAIGNRQSAIDNAVALADREIGGGVAALRPAPSPESRVPSPLSPLVGAPGFGLPSAPVRATPQPPSPTPDSRLPTPVPGYRGERATATYGVPGTPITSGFLVDLGEYNPELMGVNAVRTYEQMRRGDAQVRATLAAVKLPIQSAKWNVVPAEKLGARSEKRAGANPTPDSRLPFRPRARDVPLLPRRKRSRISSKRISLAGSNFGHPPAAGRRSPGTRWYAMPS
jgi:hypothetical protein